MVSEVAAYQAIREKWHPKVGQYLELGICTDFRSAQFILCLTTSVEKRSFSLRAIIQTDRIWEGAEGKELPLTRASKSYGKSH